jgi:hypothetical protein
MRDETRARLLDARHASPIFTVRAYCRNTECNAREVDIRIKDGEQRFTWRVTDPTVRFACPLCRQELVLHATEPR